MFVISESATPAARTRGLSVEEDAPRGAGLHARADAQCSGNGSCHGYHHFEDDAPDVFLVFHKRSVFVSW